MSDRLFLLTNDDGHRAAGLRALADILKQFGRVVIVAPQTEQSACSHAITLHRPLRMKESAPDCYAVDGTTSDCVLLASQRLLGGRKPDMVFSGINHGPNLGDDVTYSGTVAGAFEGRLFGVRSMAVSSGDMARFEDGNCMEMLSGIIERALSEDWEDDVLLNVNLPPSSVELKGVKLTCLGRRHYAESVIEKTDPRGETYYWIGGVNAEWFGEQNSDFRAVEKGYISVTPLHLDLTHYPSLGKFSSLETVVKD